MLGIGLGAAAKAYSDQTERLDNQAFRNEQLGLMKAAESRQATQFKDAQDEKAKIAAIMSEFEGPAHEVVKKLYNSDAAIFGQGEHAGKDVDVVDMPNGTKRVNFFERGTGNATGYQDFDAKQFAQHADALRNRALLGRLATVNPEWMMKARQAGLQDDEIEANRTHRAQGQKNWEATHGLQVTKADDDRNFNTEKLKLEGLRVRNEGARLAQGKSQVVTAYDSKGVPQLVRVDTTGTGQVKLPDGLTLAKPKDPTDLNDQDLDLQKKIQSQLVEVETQLAGMEKERGWFSKSDYEKLEAKRDALKSQLPSTRIAAGQEAKKINQVYQSTAEKVGEVPAAEQLLADKPNLNTPQKQTAYLKAIGVPDKVINEVVGKKKAEPVAEQEGIPASPVMSQTGGSNQPVEEINAKIMQGLRGAMTGPSNRAASLRPGA